MKSNLKVNTFHSEISIEDAEEQVFKFLRDNNFEQVDIRTPTYWNGSCVCYVIQLQYKDNFPSLVDVVEKLQLNTLNYN